MPIVYYKPVENEDCTLYYDVYILYEGTIKLPNNCEGLMANYENLNSFTTTNLDATEVEKMENFFKGCTNLTKVTVPKGVTEIDESTFAGCESIEKVSIPGTVVKINENAFKDHKEDILFIVVEKSPAQNWVEDEDLPSTVVPEASQKPDIPFTWKNDGISITITGYTGKDPHVVIPDMIEGLPVTTMDPNHACVFKPLSNFEPVDTVQHKYDIFCTICSTVSSAYEMHAYNSKGICVCGATNPDSDSTHICKYQPTDAYLLVDETQHKQVARCQACGAVQYLYKDHKFDGAGKCVCGATGVYEHICKYQPTGSYVGYDEYHQLVTKCQTCGNTSYVESEPPA